MRTSLNIPSDKALFNFNKDDTERGFLAGLMIVQLVLLVAYLFLTS